MKGMILPRGMTKTDEAAKALESIEATAALLLIVASDDNTNVKGLAELLNTHTYMLYDAHETLSGCFSGETADRHIPPPNNQPNANTTQRKD